MLTCQCDSRWKRVSRRQRNDLYIMVTLTPHQIGVKYVGSLLHWLHIYKLSNCSADVGIWAWEAWFSHLPINISSSNSRWASFMAAPISSLSAKRKTMKLKWESHYSRALLVCYCQSAPSQILGIRNSEEDTGLVWATEQQKNDHCSTFPYYS